MMMMICWWWWWWRRRRRWCWWWWWRRRRRRRRWRRRRRRRWWWWWGWWWRRRWRWLWYEESSRDETFLQSIRSRECLHYTQGKSPTVSIREVTVVGKNCFVVKGLRGCHAVPWTLLKNMILGLTPPFQSLKQRKGIVWIFWVAGVWLQVYMLQVLWKGCEKVGRVLQSHDAWASTRPAMCRMPQRRRVVPRAGLVVDYHVSNFIYVAATNGVILSLNVVFDMQNLDHFFSIYMKRSDT